MKVLVIAPHMDDEVLGVGGTIARHTSKGDEVYVCFVAHRISARQYDEEKNRIEMACTLKAKEVLRYKEAEFFNLSDERLDVCLQEIIIPLEAYINKVKPDVVYLNHRGDNHQDHKAVFQAAMVALRPSATPDIKRILCYEVPSSTEQSPPFSDLVFLPNRYVNIENHLETKVNALRCYQTEERGFPHPRSIAAISALAQMRGSQVGVKTAEAFVLIREVIR